MTPSCMNEGRDVTREYYANLNPAASPRTGHDSFYIYDTTPFCMNAGRDMTHVSCANLNPAASPRMWHDAFQIQLISFT